VDSYSSVQQGFGHVTHAGCIDTRVPVSLLSVLTSLLQKQHGGHSQEESCVLPAPCGTEANCIGLEVTPCHRAAIVALHHRQLGVNPLSFRKISATLGVPKSTCGDIYKHALNNATAKRLVQTEAGGNTGSIAEREVERSGSEVQASGGIELDKDDIPLLELIRAECLDSDARSGRPQALSEAEKDHLVATVKRNWGTRHMSLTEIQLEAVLGHVSRGAIFDTLRTRGIKAYVEECKFILDEDNKRRRVVSGTSLPRLCRDSAE